MFSGIIEEIGRVENVERIGGSVRLRIAAHSCAAALHVSDSISLNGVCQTVVAKGNESFDVEAVEETLKKTTLGSLSPGSNVNLELPLAVGDRLDGHIVLGHVDAVGQIVQIATRESSWLFTIAIPEAFVKYIVHTGSIAVDGVSLTVAQILDPCVRISIIPHTMANTIFKWYSVGSPVNLEFDVIGKYVESIMSRGRLDVEVKSSLTEVHLRELGF